MVGNGNMIGYAIGSQSNMEIGNVNKSTKKYRKKKERERSPCTLM